MDISLTTLLKSNTEYLNSKVREFYKAVEVQLEKFVGDLSLEDIKNRCRKVSCIDSPYIEQWYLDDQLLFETEIKHIGNVLKWEIRKPREVRNDKAKKSSVN